MSGSHGQWLDPPAHLRLADDEVHVWRSSLVHSKSRLDDWYRLLGESEKQRANRFYFRRDRDRFVSAHGSLRQMLGTYLEMDPSVVGYDATPYGKPFLTRGIGGDWLRFNISHSGDYALYAFSRNRELGVDIERVRTDIEIHEIAPRFFSTQEVEDLGSLSTDLQLRAFFLCWTRKEAYIKGVGEGLSMPLHTFDVSLKPNEPALLLAVRGDEREAERWSLVALSPADGYEGALVGEGASWKLCCLEWKT